MLKAIRTCVLSAAWLMGPATGRGQELHRLDVDVFNSGTVWPIWIAQDKGFFASNGLDVHLIPTPGSLAQMEGLIDGKFDVAMTAVDNLIAYVEDEGEAKTDAAPDIVAVMGSDNGFLSLITAPRAATFPALRGATLSVDAFTTGYAFVLEEMLKLRGLESGDYTLVKAGGFQQRFEGLMAGAQDGTLSVPPFTFLAKSKGFHDLGSAISVLGHYQGVVAAVRKDWAAGHRGDLVGYIRSYIAAVTWLYDPANKAEALEIFEHRLPGATPEIAGQSYGVFLDPRTGFDRRAAIDVAGVRRVMEIRQDHAVPHKALTEPRRYYDLRYYDAATKN